MADMVKEFEMLEKAEMKKNNFSLWLRTEGIKTRTFWKYTFETADKTKEIQDCEKYVDNWQEMFDNNIGLILFGRPGTGKTFASACIANALIDKEVPVLMTSFPEILNSSENKVDFVDRMNKQSLIIIDDLGVERTSQYALEVIQYIIDSRYRANKPLIITTNLSKKEVYETQDFPYLRIYDRITEMCMPLVFSCDSRRKEIAKRKIEITKRVFGYGD